MVEHPAVECLKCCIGRALQWVEDVRIKDTGPLSAKITVEHSYPAGIDIAPYVKPVIDRHLITQCIVYTVHYVKVRHGSGTLRATRSKPARQ